MFSLPSQELFDRVLAEEEAALAAEASSQEDDASDEGDSELDEIRNAAATAEDDDAPVPQATGAMTCECSGCGYTLFVAKGRESKFFPDGFACPECGAAKDTFKVTRK